MELIFTQLYFGVKKIMNEYYYIYEVNLFFIRLQSENEIRKNKSLYSILKLKNITKIRDCFYPIRAFLT